MLRIGILSAYSVGRRRGECLVSSIHEHNDRNFAGPHRRPPSIGWSIHAVASAIIYSCWPHSQRRMSWNRCPIQQSPLFHCVICIVLRTIKRTLPKWTYSLQEMVILQRLGASCSLGCYLTQLQLPQYIDITGRHWAFGTSRSKIGSTGSRL